MPGKQPSIYSSSYTTKQNCVSGNRTQLYTCFILASDQPFVFAGYEELAVQYHYFTDITLLYL